MKTTILMIFGLLISISSFSQKNKDFTFVPKGSFDIQVTNTPQTISIDNFWMSNEITNKEFREFYNQIKSSPNDSFEWIDITSIVNEGTSKAKIIKVAYSEIINKLMDESAWKSVFEKGDYFTNPKYDNYPVVGVTWDGARYYCNWRTKEENKKLKGKNNAIQMDYRIPTEFDWEYAFTFNDSKSNVGSNELHQVEKGDKNKLGLLNLNGNVSEWTSSSGSDDGLTYKVVKGNSWKSKSKDSQRELVLPDKGTDYIGFRIIQSDIKKQ
jgi:formylglycine-generating enzyme required for sulfatase activity